MALNMKLQFFTFKQQNILFNVTDKIRVACEHAIYEIGKYNLIIFMYSQSKYNLYLF